MVMVVMMMTTMTIIPAMVMVVVVVVVMVPVLRKYLVRVSLGLRLGARCVRRRPSAGRPHSGLAGAAPHKTGGSRLQSRSAPAPLPPRSSLQGRRLRPQGLRCSCPHSAIYSPTTSSRPFKGTSLRDDPGRGHAGGRRRNRPGQLNPTLENYGIAATRYNTDPPRSARPC
jgi:hypothetical protein